MGNLAQNLLDTSCEQGGRTALQMGDTVVTYDEFRDAAQHVAAGLQARGVVPGDRVGLVLPDVVSFPVVFYGALMAGAVVVPMNPLLKTKEIEYHLRDSGARLVVAAEASAGPSADAAGNLGIEMVSVDAVRPDALMAPLGVEEAVARADDDDAVILYTSGTTGRPKGAELTHANLSTNTRTVTETLLELTPDDVIVGCLPLSHAFGLTCGLNASVLSAGCLVLIPRFNAETVLSVIARNRITIFEGVPTMFSRMLNAPAAERFDTTHLRLCVSGGAAMPVEVMRQFERAFGCVVLEGYGMSETSPVVSFNHPHADRKPGSVGTPISGVGVRLVSDNGNDVGRGETGEIAVRGPNVMKGYWGRPAETAATIPDGWLRSGDLATQDENGYYTIVGRKKEMIIRGGENVYPREVEEVLYEHPAVAEAAVIGIPNPDLGEEVVAAVELKPGATATPNDLREWTKARVAAYKYPRHVWLVPSLPKGPTGKILRGAVEVPPDVSAM